MMPGVAERNFLIESNLIEDVGEEGFDDSLAAWEYIKKKDVITKRTILHVHKLLMRNLWPEIAGKFRKCNVQVGGRRCPDHYFIKTELPRILRTLNCGTEAFLPERDLKDEIAGKEEWAIDTHRDFEHLHPFRDGNGRVGRILYNWQRLKLGLPIHVIKHQDREDYYGWFGG